VTSARICVVTGTRADYGLLRPVMRALDGAEDFELLVVATGAHLSPEFGLTAEVIEADGFTIAERIEMLLSSDTPVGISTSMGLATIGMAGALERLRPDLLVVLGDRYEILAVVQAALVAKVPVAHLSGGDITEGAIDDAIRHAVTKLSHLHFVTNQESARRLRQMGEAPQRVVVAGNPGLDDLVRFEPMPRDELEATLGMQLRERNLLVTYHPVTLADEPPRSGFSELLAALDSLGDRVGMVFTLPNADPEGRVLIDMVRDFVADRPHAVAHESLGQRRYWSCLKTVDAVVGNSSSGLSEAPAAGVPAVNVGDRQRGRLRADSTIDCAAERTAILAAIQQAFAAGLVTPASPYGDGHATERILERLRAVRKPKDLLQKQFHVLEGNALWNGP
jgi:UDP-hydrolysing UDP-N-acetyl-D-glucosamine 2-epimerase